MSRHFPMLMGAAALLCAPTAYAANTPAVFKVGSFAKSTTTGTNVAQNGVAHGLGQIPKAVILWTGFESTESPTGEGIWGFGFYDGSTNRSLGYGVANNTTNSTRRRIGNSVIQILQGSGSLPAEATLTFDATNFNLTWSANTSSSPTTIHYIAIGGAKVSAKVIDWGMGTTNASNIEVNTVTFKPNVCWHAWTGPTYTLATALDTTANNAHMGIGVMDYAGRQWAVDHLSDNQATSRAYSFQRTDSAYLMITGVDGTETRRAAYVSMSPSSNFGFVLDSTGSDVNDTRMFSLCLQGVDAYAGSFTKSITAGASVAQPVTGPSFTPGLVILASDQHLAGSSPTAGAYFGMGAASGAASQGALTTTNQHNSTSADGYGMDKTSRIFVKAENDLGTEDTNATFTSFNSNGFTITWNTNDTDAADAIQMLYLALATPSATAVTVDAFEAIEDPRGRSFRWRTGREANSLGFHLYEDRSGVRRRITPALVAGSALLLGSGRSLAAGESYSWSTGPRGPGAAPEYWLEEVDLDGKRTQFGPYRAHPATSDVAALSSPLLRELGHDDLLTRTSGPPDLNALATPGKRRGWSQAPVGWPVAAGPAVKLMVDRPGYHRIDAPALIAAGLDPLVDPRRLRLYTEGQEVRARFSGEEDGRLDDGDALEFFGTGRPTAHSATRVYWLATGEGPAARMTVAPAGSALAPESFPFAVDLVERSVYFAALLDGDSENFFGPVVSATALERTLAAHHAVPGPASLRVRLQGVTDGPHRVLVSLNGQSLGPLVWSGREPGEAVFPLEGAPLDGDNVLSLVSADVQDVSLLDTVRLQYQHAPVADDGAQLVEVPAGRGMTLRYAGAGPLRAFDVTELLAPVELTVAAGAGTASIAPAGPGPRTVYWVSPERVQTRLPLAANRPSSWRSFAGADLLILTHRSLEGAAEPLRALREAQGMKVAVIDVEDIYDELDFGHKSPAALRAFLQIARKWHARPPRFVLLLGDASVDPRNYQGLGDHDLVPTKLIDTWPLETASDDWLVDFSGQGLPDLAIGRIPARTLADARMIIDKLVQHEKEGDRQDGFLVVADHGGDSNDFEAAARGALGAAPGWLTPDLRLPGQPSGSLLEALNRGPLVVDYFGHGSVDRWHGTLDGQQALGLTNRNKLSLVLSMTCLSGLFTDVQATALAEALLAAPQGGAFGVWASSGFVDFAEQPRLNERFLDAVLRQGLTLGEAARVAKAAIEDVDVRRTWVLLGDPSRSLSPPALEKPRRPPAAAGCDVASRGPGGAFTAALAMLVVALVRRRRV
jgi:hypothetical protein